MELLDLSKQSPSILGPDGRPFPQNAGRADLAKMSKDSLLSEANYHMKQFGTYLSALYGVDVPAMRRAENPFETHPWVYAGAMAIAMTVSQPPFQVVTETDEQQRIRIKEYTDCGRKWPGNKAGVYRGAIHRHLCKSYRAKGVSIKGVKPDPGHPLQQTLNRPNWIMSGSMLWQATALIQVLRGSCVWVLFGENGGTRAPGTVPAEIWPFPPELFEPVYANNQIAGWRMRVVDYLAGRAPGATILLQPHEIVRFQFINPHPSAYWKGLSRVTAAASAIALDMLAVEHNKATMVNGADPGGILVSDDPIESSEQRKDIVKDFEQRHKGTGNRRRVAILHGGLKYISTGMTNAEMEYGELRNMSRDEILAVMGVPKAVVSITDGLNYATALTQRKLLWDLTALPMARQAEDQVDHTLMDGETDNTFCAFDLSEVEALRDGRDVAIANANNLASQALRVPPRSALKAAGLDDVVEPYKDDDVWISVTGQTTETMLNPPPPPALPPASGGEQTAIGQRKLRRKRRFVQSREVTQLAGLLAPALQKRASAPWRNFIDKLQEPVEGEFADAWRSFVREAKRAALARFDSATKALKLYSKAVGFGEDDVLDTIKAVTELLRKRVRPVYVDSYAEAIAYTVDEAGIRNFDEALPEVMSAMDEREKILADSAPGTLLESVRKQVRKGIENGETVAEIRDRVARAYNVSAASGKTLQVARTESAGFINLIRHRVFSTAGLNRREWVTAEDERVRASHEVFGAAGPQRSGFNYMDLVGGGGTLRFPGDPVAPPEETILCRCIQTAV